MDKDMEMLSVLGKIAAALSRSAGHTVEVYKAEESTPLQGLSNHNRRRGSCGRLSSRDKGDGFASHQRGTRGLIVAY